MRKDSRVGSWSCGDPVGFPRSRPSPSQLFLAMFVLLLGLALGLSSCGKGEKEKPAGQAGTAALSDTVAYKAAGAQDDTTARIAAYQDFLKKYPKSGFRAGVYSRLYDLMTAKTPDQAGGFVRDHLKTETDPDARGRLYYCVYEDARDHAPDQVPALLQELAKDKNAGSDAYNMVAWDLVDTGKHLDQAISLADLGQEQASDSSTKGEILDTKGWAYFQKKDYKQAVSILEQAVAFMPEQDPQSHLAEAYTQAGQIAKARDLYKELLFTQEEPDWRARLEGLTRQLKGSVEKVAQEIDRHRQENAKPSADFSLKDLAGKEMRFADFKGKVILLNFWHPT